MKENTIKLLEQFQRANDIWFMNKDSRSFEVDFMEWFGERKVLTDNYLRFLSYLDLGPFYDDTAEVGKGGLDSAVKDFDTTIITSFPGSFRGIDLSRILEGKLMVSGGFPYLMGQGVDAGQFTLIPSETITTYMTQNPYTFEDIRNWEMLHNSNSAGIIVGIYGKSWDRDKNSKIKMLEELVKKMDDFNDVIIDFENDSQDYYGVVASLKTRKNYKILKRYKKY